MSTADWNIEYLMEKYGDDILRMCYLYLKDYQLAEDAVQETFIKAMNGYESFRHQSSEKTWLVRIAINCCKNIMRTHWFKIIKDDVSEHQEKDYSSPIEKLIDSNSIAGAVMKLDREDRKIILLYYYQEIPVKDIAKILHITVNTANQRLYRARKKLKELLKEAGYDEYALSD